MTNEFNPDPENIPANDCDVVVEVQNAVSTTTNDEDLDTTELYDVESYQRSDTAASTVNPTPETLSALTEEELRSILILLRQNNEKKWKEITEKTLSTYFKTANSLKKFVVKELIEITKFLNVQRKNKGIEMKTTGMLKADLINQLSHLVCDRSIIEKQVRKRVKLSQVPSLRDLSRRIVMSKQYPKQVLSIAYCQFQWPDRVAKWYASSHVQPSVDVVGLKDSFQPYYVPERNENGDFELFVYDKTHLGSNLRKALCLDKVQSISKKAWLDVAVKNPQVLNPTLLEVSEEGKIIDQMKERIARNMFSKEVETMMLQNGDEREAVFCKIIRESLYVADDKPGITAIDRCRYRLGLIKWLSEGVDFGSFPPYGARIKGLSYVLYEGLRSSMEAKLYLYAIAKKGTYCVRAPNTLCSESFFSTMQEMDPWGQGVLTTTGVEKHITDFTLVTAMKMKEGK